MKDIITAKETITQDAQSLLPEEIQDLLAEQALAEINEAKKVPFNPLTDAEMLDELIAVTQKKIRYLSTIDVREEFEAARNTTANVKGDDGQTREISLVMNPEPVGIDTILKTEDKVAQALKRYQSMLTDCLKQKRLLSGQMYGTRMAHTSQVSRMKRVRSISLSGNDLMKQLSAGKTNLSPETDMQRIPERTEKSNVIDLFPAGADIFDASFEPFPDVLPLEVVAVKPMPETVDENGLCSSWEDD